MGKGKKLISVLIVLTCLFIVGCATKPRPNNTENICKIFQQYPDWYWSAKAAEKKWGVPVPVQMAIMYQESSFDARARPPRKKLLWIIPWKRQSSAYGYSQALKNTWKDYEQQTGQSGKRHDFEDACDFIGWYSKEANKSCHIDPTNAYALYLAYHEGPGGYNRRSYLKQPWLIKVSRRVANRAATYSRQLQGCESSIPKNSWW